MQQAQTRTERHNSGVVGLDEILNGGFVAGRVHLIEGHPGSGKTTMAMQFLLEGIRHGEKGLLVTLSETREEMLSNSRSHGWSTEGLEIVELIPAESSLSPERNLTMYHPAEVELVETTQQLIAAVEKANPARLVIDSMSDIALLAQNSLRYRRQLLALKQFFMGRGCTVLLLDEQLFANDEPQLRNLVHSVLMLEQLAPQFGAARRRLRVLKARGTSFRGGYHDFSIQRGGVEVFPRLVASEHSHQFTPGSVASGVAALDALMGGGPDRGTSTLLMGPPGAGKSTIAMQYAVAAVKRGEHAVVFAFDENVRTLRKRTGALGMHFELGRGPGQVRLQQVDPAELSPGEFTALVRSAVEDDHARVLVIDSLNGYAHSMPADSFLTAQLHELLEYLARQGVVTLMVVAQQGMIGTNMQTPVDTSYLADTVVVFRYFEHAGQVRKAVFVAKKRGGAHEQSIRELHLDKDGIRLGEPLMQFHGIVTGVPEERERERQL